LINLSGEDKVNFNNQKTFCFAFNGVTLKASLNSALTLILCLSLTISQASAKGVVLPEVVQISPEQMQEILKYQRGVKTEYIILAQSEQEEDKEKKKEKRQSTEENIDFSPHFNVFHSFGSDSSGNAMIVFAVVGLVMVVAWLPYFPIFLYKSIKDKEGFDQHHLVSLNYVLSGKYGNQSEGEEFRYGSFLSGRYSYFVKEKDTDPWVTLGLGAEAGYFRFKDRNRGLNKVQQSEGAYWLIGPSMLFGDLEESVNPFFAKLDLLAGTSFDSDLGLVSRAEFSVNGKIYQGLSLGLGVGALYIKLKNNQGIVSRSNDLSLIFSSHLNYSF
jgi:hypothetical protein